MSALVIAPGLNTSLISPMDADLEDGFASGVSNGTTLVLPAVQGYSGLTAASPYPRTIIKETYRIIVAAIFKRLAGLTTTVQFKKPDGSTGTLTFTNGVLTVVTL